MTKLTDVTKLTTLTSLNVLFHAVLEVFPVFIIYAEIVDRIFLWFCGNRSNFTSSSSKKPFELLHLSSVRACALINVAKATS